MTGPDRECSLFCKDFRCEAKPIAMRFVTRNGRKMTWCTMVDDLCDGHWCQYSACSEHRMTSDGMCRQPTRPLSDAESVYDEKFVDPASIPRKYSKKIRGKTV
jgi:hypothetical protein